MPAELILISDCPRKTVDIAKCLGSILEAPAVIGLVGDLGAGKTVFTKGLAEGIGINNPNSVTSPTFTLINEYRGDIPIYHIDLYRLEKEEEIVSLGVEEYFQSEGIVIIEWAERIQKLFPDDHMILKFNILDMDVREICFYAYGSMIPLLVNFTEKIEEL